MYVQFSSEDDGYYVYISCKTGGKILFCFFLCNFILVGKMVNFLVRHFMCCVYICHFGSKWMVNNKEKNIMEYKCKNTVDGKCLSEHK